MSSFHSLPVQLGAGRIAVVSEVSNRLEYLILSPALKLDYMQHWTLVFLLPGKTCVLSQCNHQKAKCLVHVKCSLYCEKRRDTFLERLIQF